MLPFAFFGLIAALVLLWLERGGPQAAEGEQDGAGEAPGSQDGGARRSSLDAEGPGTERVLAPVGRRDPRLAAVLVLGGWFAVEGVVLSLSKGIVHPYYVSALAPGAGAMAGIGLYSLLRLCRRRGAGRHRRARAARPRPC